MGHGSNDPRSPAPPAASALPALRTHLLADRHTQEPLPHQLWPRLHRHSRSCRSHCCLFHREGTGETRSYRPPMLRKADRGTATVPRTRKLGLRDDPDVLPRRTRRPRSLSVPNTPLDSQARDLGRQLHKKTNKSPHHRRRPGGSPGRGFHSAAASTTPPPLHWRGGECAARLLPPVQAWGRKPRKGSAEPPQTESSARSCGGCSRTREARRAREQRVLSLSNTIKSDGGPPFYSLSPQR